MYVRTYVRTYVHVNHIRFLFYLQSDILDINEIFRELGTLVHEQGEVIGEEWLCSLNVPSTVLHGQTQNGGVHFQKQMNFIFNTNKITSHKISITV